MKKLIIVTGMIILASCCTIRKVNVPRTKTQDQLILDQVGGACPG